MIGIQTLNFQSKKFISIASTARLRSYFAVKCDQLEEAQIENIALSQVDFGPIVRAYMQRLGLVELLNQLVVTEMDVEPGIIVAGMIQDTLPGRSPLYHLEDFFRTQDSELLLGKEVVAEDFRDHNVGRVLDRIYEVGTQRIFSQLSYQAATLFELDTQTGHWDSTSVSVRGNYDVYGDADPDDQRIKITYGYSKDKRPDLKQFLISTLCFEYNIPLLGWCHDGNASDKTLNNNLLTSISKHLKKFGINEQAYTHVADSAVVTGENLLCFVPRDDAPPLYFLTRCPFTYDEAKRVVTEAVNAGQWSDLGSLNQTKVTAKRPAASYKAYETNVTLYDRQYRAIVIHSSAQDKRRQKRIDRKLANDRKILEDKMKPIKTRSFACLSDAEAELKRLTQTPSYYYTITGNIEQKLVYPRGRPRKNAPRKIRERRFFILPNITEKKEAIEKNRQQAGCFVLLTNRPKNGADGQTPKQLLETYKGQSGIEHNFGFLKDPLIVNDLFLKKPERIEALGMILLMSLLIWNLMQRSMRLYVKNNNTTLPGWDGKKTDRPTSFMMTTKFKGLHIVRFNGKRTLKPCLNPIQIKYLDALGLDHTIFTDSSPPENKNKFFNSS